MLPPSMRTHQRISSSLGTSTSTPVTTLVARCKQIVRNRNSSACKSSSLPISSTASASASPITIQTQTTISTPLSSATVIAQTQLQDPEDDTDVLIEFIDVCKSFGDKVILNGASFKIRRGEAVGIIGASGTGKSTTLRLAAGLLVPDSGVIKILGKTKVGLLSDTNNNSLGKKTGEEGGEEPLRIGMVFQNAALFDSLDVGANVGFLLYEHSSLPLPAIKALVADSLQKVGLRGVEDLYPSELSGGMKKRVALARAVVSDMRQDVEQVIMYDEPTAGLDPVASTIVEDLMRNLHQTGSSGHDSSSGSSSDGEGGRSSSNGTRTVSKGRVKGISSYIVVTHQHSTIRRAVDRIIFLHQGKVVWDGPVSEFDTTTEPIVRQFSTGSLYGPISYV